MEASLAELTWDRGALEAECDRSAQVREGVETYLGRKVFGADGDVVVRVTLTRTDEQGTRRVEARVSQQDAQGRTWGERTVTGDDTCSSLDEQLTLVVALMVDAPEPPLAEPVAAEAVPPPPPPPRPPPAVTDESEILTVPTLQRAPPAPSHAAVLGFGVAALGVTPEVGVGAGLGATFKPRGFWGLGVDVAWLSPRRQALGDGSLEVSALLAGANLCPVQVIDGPTWWSACGSLQVARLHARSRGLVGARSESQLFALPGLLVRGGRIFGSSLLLAGGLQLSFPVSPDQYVYRDAEGERHSAFKVGSLVLMASVGLGILSH